MTCTAETIGSIRPSTTRQKRHPRRAPTLEQTSAIILSASLLWKPGQPKHARILRRKPTTQTKMTVHGHIAAQALDHLATRTRDTHTRANKQRRVRHSAQARIPCFSGRRVAFKAYCASARAVIPESSSAHARPNCVYFWPARARTHPAEGAHWFFLPSATILPTFCQ